MNDFGNIKHKINIKDIKSFYILNNMFSFLYKKQILNVIKYNKLLQKKFLFDIKDYKKISGKYKIGEKNGKGKEYLMYSNILKFEGEYLYGKRNGKGKEYYDDGKLKFEGEYLNGKRNGKGEEYYNDGTLEFEGEYLNGKRWNGKGYKNRIIDFEINKGNGKGREYYDDGFLKFEGEYLNGKRNGKGREYYNNDGKLKFEGEYLNDKNMEKEMNIMMMVIYYLKENIWMEKDGMEKYIIRIE